MEEKVYDNDPLTIEGDLDITTNSQDEAEDEASGNASGRLAASCHTKKMPQSCQIKSADYYTEQDLKKRYPGCFSMEYPPTVFEGVEDYASLYTRSSLQTETAGFPSSSSKHTTVSSCKQEASFESINNPSEHHSNDGFHSRDKLYDAVNVKRESYEYNPGYQYHTSEDNCFTLANSSLGRASNLSIPYDKLDSDSNINSNTSLNRRKVLTGDMPVNVESFVNTKGDNQCLFMKGMYFSSIGKSCQSEKTGAFLTIPENSNVATQDVSKKTWDEVHQEMDGKFCNRHLKKQKCESMKTLPGKWGKSDNHLSPIKVKCIEESEKGVCFGNLSQETEGDFLLSAEKLQETASVQADVEVSMRDKNNCLPPIKNVLSPSMRTKFLQSIPLPPGPPLTTPTLVSGNMAATCFKHQKSKLPELKVDENIDVTSEEALNGTSGRVGSWGRLWRGSNYENRRQINRRSLDDVALKATSNWREAGKNKIEDPKDVHNWRERGRKSLDVAEDSRTLLNWRAKPRRSLSAIEGIKAVPEKLQLSDSFKCLHEDQTEGVSPRRATDWSYDGIYRKPLFKTKADYNEKEIQTKSYEPGFIDTHCHLDFLFERVKHGDSYLKFQQESEDPFPASYEGCVTIFCKPWTFEKISWWEGIIKEPQIWAAFGCHPHFVESFGAEEETYLKLALINPKTVALGEIGLDYGKKSQGQIEVQKEVFRRQLKIALSLQKPVVIHCRNAHEDCMEIVKEILPLDYRIHVHCFTGTWKQAEEWLETFSRLYLGITNLVNRTSDVRCYRLQMAAKRIPLGRLLLETDAPYFRPHCLQDSGYNSHPGMAIHVAAQIAHLKGKELQVVLSHARQNTRDMYGI